MNVPCVYSNEQLALPEICETGDKPLVANKPLDCANGLGTLTMITGTFGFLLAHLAIQEILRDSPIAKFPKPKTPEPDTLAPTTSAD